ERQRRRPRLVADQPQEEPELEGGGGDDRIGRRRRGLRRARRRRGRSARLAAARRRAGRRLLLLAGRRLLPARGAGRLDRARPLAAQPLAERAGAGEGGLLDERGGLARLAGLPVELGAQELQHLLAHLGVGELVEQRVDGGGGAARQEQ